MAEPRKVTIQLQPGVLTSQSEYASPGRYIDMDQVRFNEGLPEKMGGNLATDWLAVTGTPRSALSWLDNSSNRRIATGSAEKLEVLNDDGDTLTDITPVRDSGTLAADPITTVSGSAVVSMEHTAHAVEQGDYVTFGGADAAGGITIDGEYVVLDVTDANNFTITHSSAATSSVTGGGSSVTYSYAISNGDVDTTAGGGWGVGPFGEETFGTERTVGTKLQLATRWSLDNYGEDLIAMRNDTSSLYYHDVSVGGRAAPVSNAPTGTWAFVTTERVIMVLGAGGDPMRVRSCDDNDITDWTPAISNKSINRLLNTGSRLVCGAILGQGINVVWSDTTVYVAQFANNNTTVYNFRNAARGDDYGIIGSGAFVMVGSAAYWMSSTDFKMYAGSPGRMPKVDDIRNYVFDDMNITQAQKISCRYDPIHHEIFWEYPSLNSNENDRYAMFSLDEGLWSIGKIEGTLQRSCFATQTEQTSIIIGFDPDGDSFQHEVGVDNNGAALPWYIETGFSDVDEGNVTSDIFAVIPDFKRHSGDIALTLTSYDYATDAAAQETYEDTISENIGKLDTRMTGRQIKIRMAGSAIGSDFRLGRIRLGVVAGGER